MNPGVLKRVFGKAGDDWLPQAPPVVMPWVSHLLQEYQLQARLGLVWQGYIRLKPIAKLKLISMDIIY